VTVAAKAWLELSTSQASSLHQSDRISSSVCTKLRTASLPQTHLKKILAESFALSAFLCNFATDYRQTFNCFEYGKVHQPEQSRKGTPRVLKKTSEIMLAR